MQSKIRNKLKFLDGKVLLDKYVELGKAGSLRTLQEWVVLTGMVNPDTRRPPTKMGIWAAMWRWVLRNPEEGRKMYSRYVMEWGDYLNDEEWYSLLESRARILLTVPGYRRYMRKYPELVKYGKDHKSE